MLLQLTSSFSAAEGTPKGLLGSRSRLSSPITWPDDKATRRWPLDTPRAVLRAVYRQKKGVYVTLYCFDMISQ